MLTRSETDQEKAMRARARAVQAAGGLEQAVAEGSVPKLIDCSLSEALVLGLLKQGVRKYFAIFGHGSTDLGNVLRIYEEEGVTRTVNCRNEVEMAHAATALRWQYGETPAVVTSIGPGAMQALAGSLAAASNGVGVYHIYGDETTFGEGYNMQQVPKEEQGLFGRITAVMGQSYVLHTPAGLRDALRRGALVRQSSVPRRAVLSAAAAQHPADGDHRQSERACRQSPCCRCWRRPTMPRSMPPPRSSRRPARSRSRPAAAAAATTPRCGGWRKPPAPRWCCRPARPACCPTPTRRTCMSAARRARSAATTPWARPSC